jgi:hypothetical protein
MRVIARPARRARPAAFAAFAMLALLGASKASAQQKFQAVGPNECLNCHDHDDERAWYEKKEIPEVQKLFPDKGANAGHINSLKQLETPKSNDFAKAIGLADKYDLNGACVKCHATVFAGDANAGVSCESCHGPASGYLKPHQTKGAYDQSVAQFGMTPLVGKIQAWTQQCSTCHIMDDQRLITAGHPSGDDFDLGKKYAPVYIHFKKQYAVADIESIARSEFAAILAKRRGVPAVAAGPAPAPPVASAAAPPPAAAASAPASAPAVAAPPPSAPAATARAETPPAPAPAAASPATAPDAAPPPAAAPAPAVQTPPAAPPVTTVPAGFGGFVQNNWQWLWAVVVIPIALVFWLLGKKSRR